jgi:single-strand DNA-binding protein
MYDSKGTINKVMVIGRLGSDPEVRYTPAGSTVANFRVATNNAWKDKDGGKKEDTTWHRIVAWNKLAEVVKEYVKKGHRVYVEGRLQTRSWEDQNGQTRYMTEIVANQIQMLESPGAKPEPVEEAPDTPEIPPPDDMEPAPDDSVPF